MRSMIALAFLAVFAVAGCETTKGAGKDIENTGSNMQRGINASQSNYNNTTSNMSNSSGMGAGLDNNSTGGADTGVGSGSQSGMGGGY
ncbi:MAG: hypothetical protein ACM3OC_04655 [Deltaproteobacteria bacterium]